MPTKTLMSVAALIATIFTGVANADFMFTENFDGPSLNPNLEVTNGFGGYTINGTIGNLSFSEREYVRTVDSDYQNFDYQITVNHDSFVGNDIAFVGVGNGSPDSAFSNEPGFGSLMFRLHNPALQSGRIDLAYWQSGNQFEELNLANIAITNEPARINIRRAGDILTMSFDTNFNGTYSPDVIREFDLADSQYAALRTSLNNESRLFFGSTFGTRFDDFVVVRAIPEPGMGLVTLFVPSLIMLRRRR